MGATKRVAELIVTGFNQHGQSTVCGSFVVYWVIVVGVIPF